MTVLKMVQKVLSSLSSDEVSTISETVESVQILDILEDVFNNLVTNKIIKSTEGLTKLETPSSSSYPNYLYLSDPTVKLTNLKYNVGTSGMVEYRDIHWQEPAEFLQRMMRLKADDDNVTVVVDYSGVKLLVQNDEHPHFFTSFDNKYLIFDSWDSNEDSILQASKSVALAQKIPAFTRSDSFVPDIDETLFPLLLNEVKSWAHLELRQNGHQKAEQQARSQRVSYQKFRDRLKEDDTRPDYGRRR
jgi:hypothetical protein